MSSLYPMDVMKVGVQKYRAHIFLEGQHHYGEGFSIGGALMELGHYLEQLRKPNDLEILFNEIRASGSRSISEDSDPMSSDSA